MLEAKVCAGGTAYQRKLGTRKAEAREKAKRAPWRGLGVVSLAAGRGVVWRGGTLQRMFFQYRRKPGVKHVMKG